MKTEDHYLEKQRKLHTMINNIVNRLDNQDVTRIKLQAFQEFLEEEATPIFTFGKASDELTDILADTLKGYKVDNSDLYEGKEIVKLLLNSGKLDLLSTDKGGKPALYYLARENKLEKIWPDLEMKGKELVINGVVTFLGQEKRDAQFKIISGVILSLAFALVGAMLGKIIHDSLHIGSVLFNSVLGAVGSFFLSVLATETVALKTSYFSEKYKTVGSFEDFINNQKQEQKGEGVRLIAS